MEKLTLTLATLGLTTSLGVFASTPTSAQPFQVTVPDIKAGFDFTLTGLYLQPTASDSQLFYTRTYSDGAFTDHSVDPDYSPAFGLGIGYAFKNSGNDVRLNWTHLNSSDDASADASGGFGIGTPPTNTTSSNVKFKYDAVDFDFGQYLNIAHACKHVGLLALALRKLPKTKPAPLRLLRVQPHPVTWHKPHRNLQVSARA